MLERRPFAVFVLRLRAIAGVQVILKVRAEVDFLERVLGWGRRLGHGAIVRPIHKLNALHPFLALLPPRNLVQHGNSLVNLFQDRVFHHLGIDHLLQLELVERKHGDHLHQARGKDLALRYLERHSWLQQRHD